MERRAPLLELIHFPNASFEVLYYSVGIIINLFQIHIFYSEIFTLQTKQKGNYFPFCFVKYHIENVYNKTFTMKLGLYTVSYHNFFVQWVSERESINFNLRYMLSRHEISPTSVSVDSVIKSCRKPSRTFWDEMCWHTVRNDLISIHSFYALDARNV